MSKATNRLLFDVEPGKVDGGTGSQQICQLLFSEGSDTSTSGTAAAWSDGTCPENNMKERGKIHDPD